MMTKHMIVIVHDLLKHVGVHRSTNVHEVKVLRKVLLEKNIRVKTTHTLILNQVSLDFDHLLHIFGHRLWNPDPKHTEDKSGLVPVQVLDFLT